MEGIFLLCLVGSGLWIVLGAIFWLAMFGVIASRH